MVHLVQCQQPTDEHGRVPRQIAALNLIAFNVELGALLQPLELNDQETEDHPEPQPRAGKEEEYVSSVLLNISIIFFAFPSLSCRILTALFSVIFG